MSKDLIRVGEFVVVQKHNYKKLHKLNKPDSSVTLGKDNVNLSGIVGCPYFSIFKMIPGGKRGREFRLELTDGAVALKDEIDIKTSGADNRNIIDDGRSQKLTHSEIADLTNDSSKASHIVESLISNSNTFHNKTEFSQEKYLRKKEKKYFEYLQVLKPNLRLIAEIMYKLEATQIQSLRMDTLSQMITMSNIQSDGVHLLYDSGSNGLVAAALISAIGANTEAKLIHMHPGNMYQKQAIQAMNFQQEQLNRCISVNIYSVLRQIYQGCDTNDGKHENVSTNDGKHENVSTNDPIESSTSTNESQLIDSSNTKELADTDTNGVHDNPLKRKAEDEIAVNGKVLKQDDSDIHKNDVPGNTSIESNKANPDEKGSKDETSSTSDVKQVVISDKELLPPPPPPKKPKWHSDNIKASEMLMEKIDSLVIACKESPLSIFNELVKFVKPGRPFVIYHTMAELLQEIYLDLKMNPNVSMLKLTCNWMRNYQVLPDRTHPEVTMNNQSGFLLTGYILK